MQHLHTSDILRAVNEGKQLFHKVNTDKWLILGFQARFKHLPGLAQTLDKYILSCSYEAVLPLDHFMRSRSTHLAQVGNESHMFQPMVFPSLPRDAMD